MNMKKVLGMGVIVALAALMVVSLASAQPGGGGGGMGGGMGGGRGMGMGGGRGGVTAETLGATAEEWKVLEAKVTKVQTLSQQLQGGGRGGRGGRGMGGEAAPAAPETDLSKARTALNALVGPEATGTPTPDQIKAALTAYRQARDKAKTELAAAQADLKKVVNAKQEAILVVRGMLD